MLILLHCYDSYDDYYHYYDYHDFCALTFLYTERFVRA